MRSRTFPALIVAFVLALAFSTVGCQKAEQKPETNDEPKTTEKTSDTSAKKELDGLFSKAKQVEGISAEYVVTTKQGGVSSKIWLMGSRVKTETDIGGKRMVALVDGDGGIYTYYPDEKIGTKLTSKAQVNLAETPLEAVEDLDTGGMKFEKDEVVDGVATKVFGFVAVGMQAKIWVREDIGLPVKIESIAKDGTTTVIEYKNVEIGPIADDVFTVPSDIQITDVSVPQDKPQELPR
ncbi:MAG: LolA family protein [Candidatus Aquicultorales bacterium]